MKLAFQKGLGNQGSVYTSSAGALDWDGPGLAVIMLISVDISVILSNSSYFVFFYFFD